VGGLARFLIAESWLRHAIDPKTVGDAASAPRDADPIRLAGAYFELTLA
jgi:hypothetical protein